MADVEPADQPSPVERDRHGRPLPPPGVRPTSIKYAAIVPLAAVVMLTIFIVINSLGNQGPAKAAAVSPKLEKVSGLTVSHVVPFAPYVTSSGEPPADILSSVVFPEGISTASVVANQGEATSFDETLTFHSPASAEALYTFFHQQMQGRDWKIFSTGAPVDAKGVEILSQKAGSDGWFWTQGVIVSPTTFNAHDQQSTKVTVRLFQVSDGD